MGKNNVETFTPNTRFGATFLDVLYNKRAVKDEVMLDKQAGDIVYKRRDDGRILWYSQENIQLFDFMSQIRSRTDACNTWAYPDSHTDVYKNSYFMSCLLDVTDWEFEKQEGEDVNTKHSLLKGDKLLNCYPDAFSVSQEATGFFIKLNIAPKDLAYINLLNSRYNVEYEDYEGEDEELLAKKAMFDKFGFTSGHFSLNYTITWYDVNGDEKASETADGYLCANEICFIPYENATVYKRSEVNSAKLTINYLSAPKLVEGLALCTTPVEKKMINAVKDNTDLSFQTMNFSFFMTTSDDDIYLPSWINHSEIILMMSVKELEDAMDRAAAGGASGIIATVKEPDEKHWHSTKLWLELMREFIPPESYRYTGSPTTIGKIENELKGIEYEYTNFSSDKSSVKDFWVENTGQIQLGGNTSSGDDNTTDPTPDPNPDTGDTDPSGGEDSGDTDKNPDNGTTDGTGDTGSNTDQGSGDTNTETPEEGDGE